ncbi:hypothetical protein [Herbinix luporum]|uniref:Uncharacterized protein n=1 Tax=Herbinix luporum TaxID=1679721 RepID=A0A0K8J6I2_9FIRM|nr:hypothetical protein [Herbinix luporum]CUH92958.1 hypothetical protein SD1D_1412 [Herbinix luporum]
MSVCTFIAANCIMNEVRPSKKYPLKINIDEGTIDDGDADDNFYLWKFCEVYDYTDKKYGLRLDCAYYTEGRAKLILKYISDVLSRTDTIEVWHVWLDYGYDEYDERPIIKKKTLHIDEISPEDIREFDNAVIWENSYSIRPIFYCWEIIK